MAAWQELVTVLEEQLTLYEAMLELGQKKSDLIVDGKVRELEKLVLAEEKLLAQGGALEVRRQEVHDELARGLPLEEETVTLRSLTSHAPGEWQDALVACEENLVQCLAQLGQQNHLNGQLLENALRLVNYQLSILEPDASGMERRAYLDRKA